jgi:PAS domain S-box-containing protein
VATSLVLDTANATLALVLGVLSLVRYYSRRRRTYLFVGTAFLASGILDLFVVASHPLVTTWVGDAAVEGFLPWSWLVSRGFLAIYLFLSLQASRGSRPVVPRIDGERNVYLTAALALVVAMGSFSLLRGAPPVFESFFFRQPLELIPATFFFLTGIGYLRRGNWHKDVFERWFIAGLLLATLVHLFFTGRSAVPLDTLFVVGHGLKLLSYAAILIGVLMGVHITFRREERALEAIQEINDVLGREVKVRREAEAVLQRSEERLQNFLDTAHDLIQSTAPDGRILYVNPAWERTLGYSRRELQSLNLWELVHPSCRDAFMERYDEVLDTGGAPGIEVEFLTRDGRVVICAGSATRHMVDGKVAAVQAIFRDVSQQQQAERDLAASRASLEAVVESTGDSIWSVDSKMRLVTFNTAFALGVEARSGREARGGDAPEDLFEPEDALWYREVYARVLRGDRFSELREEVFAGHTRLFEVFCHPITGEEGIAGAVMFGKDVTRRIRAEEALRMAKDEAEGANRAKSQFLANMSHELRTPLNSVIGFANILLKNKKGNLTDQDLGFLERILANGRHLLSLINEVLDLAKIEAGRMELEIHEVDMEALVVETLGQLEGQAQERRVQLHHSIPEGLATVETDRAKLKQVIINLVGNALKFSAGGTVTVVVEAVDGRPGAIAVKDTGIGIPEDRLKAIFEAFQQADGSTTRQYGGTGLGLTISRSICQLLGYDLEVDSTVGEGSTFTIRMEGGTRPQRAEGERSPHPADDEVADDTPAGEQPGGAHGDARDLSVLVVDDESDSRVLMTHYLRDFGCRVFTASGAEEGIEMARREQPDLITLDLMMPGMSGWEALQRLKEDPATRDIPVVVVSIVAAEGRGRLLGAVDLLTKPVEREDLLRVIWRNLVRRRGGRVLVVDPEEEVRRAMTAFLEASGLEVTGAPNGREALRMVEEDAPDVVVMELVMPVMDGMTFLQRLRQNPYHTGLPVIVVTGKELTRSERVALDERASAVLRKGDGVEGRLREVMGRILPLREAEGADRR